jgi:hypothetical protein
MNRLTLQMRNFARRLIADESRDHHLSATKAPQGFVEVEKLRRHLTTFMGHTGVNSLLTRTLALSAAEVPWLRGVQVKVDDSLAGLAELEGRLPPDEALEGRVVLLAHLLGLLMVFIGAGLTLRLVAEVWPQVPLDDLDFSAGGEKEPEKIYVKI